MAIIKIGERKFFRPYAYGVNREYGDFSDAAEYFLSGSDYERGLLEELSHTAENNIKAIGRLLEMLVDRRVLQSADALLVLTGESHDLLP